jgi:hypothetical protein
MVDAMGSLQFLLFSPVWMSCMNLSLMEIGNCWRIWNFESEKPVAELHGN